MRLGGAQQRIAVSVPVSGRGLLHLAIQELGISATAEVAGTDSPAASPIDRLGTLTLTRDIPAPQSVLVLISSIDSRGIEGTVCIEGELLNPPRSGEARAWRLTAAADRRTAHRQWQQAFDDDLSAARQFDRLGMRGAAAGARHAMAELAYRYLRRTRDALALITTTLADRTVPAVAGERLELMGRALTEYSSQTEPARRRVTALLHAAAIRFKSSAEGRRELPRLAIHQGYIDYRSGIPDAAEREFDSAAEECKQLHDSECFAQARMDIAAMAEDRKNYATALAAYEDALDSLDVARMPKIGADIHYDLARLESRVGLFRRSAADQDAAMRLYAQLGRCDLVRLSASSLGEMLVQVGSVSDAIDDLDRAATLDCEHLLEFANGPRGNGDSAGDGMTRREDNSSIGGGPVVFAACTHPTSVAESTSDGKIAAFQALLTLGNIAKADDDLTIVDACQKAARRYSVDARTHVRLLNARGELELELRRVAAARETFTGALRLTEAAALTDATEFRGTAEQGLAQAALAGGEVIPARRHAIAAIRLALARGDVTQLVASLRLLASSEAAAGSKDLAARTLRSAIALLEQVPTGELNPEQRATYLATQYAVFGELTDLLIPEADRSGGAQAWEAFEVAEEGHARSLRYAMEIAVHERAADTAQAASREYRALIRSIAGLSADGVTTSYAALPGRLDTLTRRSAGSDPVIQRRELAHRLAGMHSLLIEYAAGQDDMYAFVTGGTVMHAVRLGSRAAIEHAATAFVDRLRAPEPEAPLIRRAAVELARLVWWPLHPYLRGERVVIVPDGVLHTIPFAALPWSSESSTDLTVQHVELSSVPSTLLLTMNEPEQTRSSAKARFVLLGDPVFRANTWLRNCAGSMQASTPPDPLPAPLAAAFRWARPLPSLPGTRAEIVSVARIVHRWRRAADVETLLGCRATDDMLRDAAPAATVIHMATHGLIDARRPRLSALALTPGPEGDAAFRLFDILQLHLRARMVVLSACDTSQGRLLPGEGVLGLAQAFLQAGSQSVIASYWRVEDAKVAPFMDRFYRHLLSDRLPVATALRRTQVELARQGDSYGWAAFSLYGRPDSTL